MTTIHLTVIWPPGLHLRAAALLVKLARRFQSRISLRAGRRVAGADNIMQLLLLEAPLGTRLTVVAEGPDESIALRELTEFFGSTEFLADSPEPTTLPDLGGAQPAGPRLS
ncbi:MAG TPA: HPr family phosphocarrier protein [Verrucomicrobiae bacterium]|nr:HPr family phosphocarrier protein [Verrucomicrobiae bacterium]